MPDLQEVLPRSYLYVPGDRPDRFHSAATSTADAVIFDLEDSVLLDAKDRARACLSSFFESARPSSQWWVRINADSTLADIDVAAVAVVKGIFVPRASVRLLQDIDRQLRSAESDQGMPEGSVEVIPLVETAGGLMELDAMAAVERVSRFGIGEVDLAADLRMRPSEDRHEMWPLRTTVVVASAAAGLQAPVGPVESSLGDDEALRRSTELQFRQGFGARTAIHPKQVPVIHQVFTPTPQEVERAEEVVALLAEAAARGSGVAVAPSGRMLDAAVLRSAHEVLARVGRV